MAEDPENPMPPAQSETPISGDVLLKTAEKSRDGSASDGIIRALLQLAPSSISKETKVLLHQVHRFSIPVIYNKIIRLNKLSNKELLHFITIMNAHPCYDGPTPYSGLNLDDLINLKFPAQDKYLGQVAVGYFGIVEKVYDSLSQKHRLEIFYRYLYLFENGICTDIALYPLFSLVLRKDFLDIFLFRQFYLNFIFLKEFLVDFSAMGNRIVKIGYEVPQAKELVYQLLLSQNAGDTMPNWLVQRWSVPTKHSVSEMFYLFDCVYFMDDLANRHFGMAGDILETITNDLEVHGYVDGGENGFVATKNQRRRSCINDTQSSSYRIPPEVPDAENHTRDGEIKTTGDTSVKLCENTDLKIKKMIEAKKKFVSSILTFNKTMQMENLDVKHLRISPLTDLKALGEVICKEKNADLLLGFIKSFSFHKIDILESLRTFLSSFYLIGESQIIERIVRIFVEVYLEQNNIGSAHSFDAYKSVAYSFIVLNTMLHNPSIDKKPPFEEYYRLLNHTDDSAIDKETLRSYYNSIKDREIKFPTAWEDSYDKYLLSIQLSKERFQSHSPSRAGVFDAAGSGGTETSVDRRDGQHTVGQKEIVFGEAQSNLHMMKSSSSHITLCYRCIILPYKHLFSCTYRNFFFMDPLNFSKICKLIGTGEIYCSYILKNRLNVSKALIASKYYLESYTVQSEIVEEFVILLGKIEKPKASVFSELKSLFSTSKSDLHGADFDDKIMNSVLPPFSTCLEVLLKMKFTSKEICNSNVRAIAQYLSSNNSGKNDSYFVQNFFAHIIIHNIEMIDDVAYLDKNLAYRVIDAKFSLLNSLSDDEKLMYFNSRSTFEEHEFNIFRKIELYNSDGFDVFCKMQPKYGDLDRVITVKRESLLDDEIDAGRSGEKAMEYAGFKVYEKYAESLENTKNILKLFTTSNSILNLRIVKSIHKNACPLTMPLFLDFDKIAYLFIKCNGGSEDLVNYALYVVNYLSDSLVLLIRIYSHVYPILRKMDPGFRHSLMKILVKRLETFKKTGNVCCEQYKDEGQQQIQSFLEKLLADSFISKDDISFLPSAFELGKSEVVEL